MSRSAHPPLSPPTLKEMEAARRSVARFAIRTPLLALDLTDGPAPTGAASGAGIHLKLECLQPVGSFKIRGAAHALASAPPEALAAGVYTASAGNMAQGVAFAARAAGVRCRVVVPDTAPPTKLDAIARLGAEAVPVPYAEWWRAIEAHGHPGERGLFIHPVADPAVVAGNATVGLEILEDLPAVGAVFVPYGGGGLSCGIAAALQARGSRARVYAAEVETAAPFAASLEADAPVRVERTPSFVDGIGGSSVLPEMWPMARELLAGSVVVSLAEVCDAIRTLAIGPHVVAEGAGGAALAAARAALEERLPGTDEGPVVAVISGGNLDAAHLAAILRGDVPA